MVDRTDFIYYGMLALLAVILILWETLAPAFPRPHTRRQRWPSNIALFTLNRIVLQLVTTTYLANFAYIAWKNRWGLLNQWALSPVFLFFLSLLALDLKSYSIHRFQHKITFLWRIHRLHHSDTTVDVTTSSRFHPLEVLLTFTLDLAFIFILGPSFIAVFVNNFLIFATGLFTHANIQLPPGLDRNLRWITGTPSLHHIHHSRERNEADSNYAVILTWWDRLLGTYRERPQLSYDRLRMGVEGYDSPEDMKLPRMLANPFIPRRVEPTGLKGRREWIRP